MPTGSGLRVWATEARDGRVRVVLINDSRRRWVTTAVRPPRPAAGAVADRLRAPRLGARTGITIAGQSFGRSTATADLAGPLRESELSPVQGRFVVRLPPASATLLTIRG